MLYKSIIKNFSMTPYIHADIILRNEPIKLKLTKDEIFHKYPLETAFIQTRNNWNTYTNLVTGKSQYSANPYHDFSSFYRVYGGFTRNVYQLIKPDKVAIYTIDFRIPDSKTADDMKHYYDFNYNVTHITIVEKWGATIFPTRKYLNNQHLECYYDGKECKYLKDFGDLYFLNGHWLYQTSKEDLDAMLQFIGALGITNTYYDMRADAFITNIIRKNRSVKSNPNTISPEQLYEDILNRPLPDWDLLQEQYHYTTSYPAVAERIGDTICITLKAYGGAVYRYILNKKHTSIFYRHGNHWDKENTNPWGTRDAHIINWSYEISEGTLAQCLGRAKYFGEAPDNANMIRAIFQRAKNPNNRYTHEKEYLQDIIQLLDMDSFHKAMQGNLKNIKFTSVYGKTIEFRDIFREYISYNSGLICDPNSKDIYTRHGISKGQLKTLLSLYEGEDGLNRNVVCDIISGLVAILRNGQNNQTQIDFRGFDPIKFNKYTDYCKKIGCAPLNSYNAPRLPDGCDKFKMLEFWMNHNYTMSDLQILRDYIHMHQTLNPDTPLTVEDYKIKDLDDLRRRHDRLVIAVKEFNDKSFAEKWATQKPKWEKFCYQDKDFEILAPESGEEVITEGRVLSHCVGGYVDRIARGETIILFMRKKSDPKTPFYTLNINPDGTRLIQVHGYKNRWPATDPETLPFLDKWVEKFKFQGWDYIRSVNRDHY